MVKTRMIVTVLAIGFLMTGISRADLFDPAIDNPSFEFPDTGGGYSHYLDDWFEEDIKGSFCETEQGCSTIPDTPYAVQWGGLSGGTPESYSRTYQQIGTWDENVSYEVKLLLGKRLNRAFANVRVALWAGGDPALAADGTTLADLGAVLIANEALNPWPNPEDDPLCGTSEESVILNTDVGQTPGAPLWIAFSGFGGGQAFYDNTSIELSDPSFNSPPVVDAGDYQSISLTETNTAQLDGTVVDDGKPEPPTLTSTWSQLSGPGTVDFSDTSIVDPTATFSAAGIYELQLSASDGEKDACDVVTIYARLDDDPIAHWAFEEGNGTSVGDSSAFNNVGTFVGEPNWAVGWVGNWAIECSDNAYVNITVDSAADPNLDSQEYEITVATWVKVNSWLTSSNWNGIVTKGNGDAGGGWSLIRNSSSDSLSFYTPSAGYVGGSVNVKDGNWHHVAAVHDGMTISLYVDGVLDASATASGFLATSTAEIWLNGNSEYPDGGFFAGLLDDVRIYSYAISESQITELVAMGQGVPPSVDAGADETFYVQNGSLQLDATVTDETPPQAALLWTKESGPGTVDFSDATIEDPIATFSEVGAYLLRLTADDPLGVAYDEVTITVENPTCQDVIDDGFLMAGDISGPAGIPDCRVNLYDFAAFAGNWFRCNNPLDPECESLY